MNPNSNATNGSLVKAFSLLDYFSFQKPKWGVRELARHAGANESTTYRMMATMESLGILQKDPITEKYELGLKLFELGNRVDIQSSFVQLTHPELEKVALEIEETVHLGVLHQQDVLMVDKVESVKGLRLDSSIGQTSPLYCTGIGKVLLAFEEPKSREAIIKNLNFEAYTSKTLTCENKLNNELDKIARLNYAIDNQEYELGLICVAVPVKNTNNKLVAALSAAGPSDRFKKSSLNEYVEILQSGAEAIKDKIGKYKM